MDHLHIYIVTIRTLLLAITHLIPRREGREREGERERERGEREKRERERGREGGREHGAIAQKFRSIVVS